MNEETKIRQLLTRLSRICSISGKWELWPEGVAIIEKKFGIAIYLSKFEPQGFCQTETPTMILTIEGDNDCPTG